MELALTQPPTPAEAARALALVLVACTAVLFLAGWLKRSALHAVVTALAYVLFVVAAAALLIAGLSLVYPHHHHDIRWTPNGNANYVIDLLIGLTFWSSLHLAYRRSWKGRGRLTAMD